MTKAFSRVGLAFSLLPWLWGAGLAALVIRARIFLGYWPRPSMPDPKLLPFELHHMVLMLSFYLLAWLLPLALSVHAVLWIASKRKPKQRPLWIFAGGWLLIAAMTFSSPTRFNWVAWFLD